MAGLGERPLRTIARGLARSLSIVLLLAAWEWLARSGHVTPFMLPALSDVLDRIRQDAVAGDLLINARLTLYRALAGFSIAAAAGIAIGAAMARGTIARWLFDPIVSVGFPMPKIAFLPIMVLWLGLFDASKIAMVVLDAIFPVITATAAGIASVASVERELIWSARNMGAREPELVWHIILPAALPQLLTGLQVALPIGSLSQSLPRWRWAGTASAAPC